MMNLELILLAFILGFGLAVTVIKSPVRRRSFDLLQGENRELIAENLELREKISALKYLFDVEETEGGFTKKKSHGQ